MRLPKEIKIGNTVYGVKLVDEPSDYISGAVHSLNGSYIKLNRSLSEKEMVDALFYETIHVMFDKVEFDYYDGSDEEPVVLMGEMMANLIRENDFSFMRDKSINLKDN